MLYRDRPAKRFNERFGWLRPGECHSAVEDEERYAFHPNPPSQFVRLTDRFLPTAAF